MFEHDHHEKQHGAQNMLGKALFITFAFAGIEAVGGWFSGSLALISDAGHMITDSAGLLLAWFAARIARMPADEDHSWGHGRAEVLAALASGVFMLGIAASIVWHAIERIQAPTGVDGSMVIGIGMVGLLINIWVLKTLHGDHSHAHSHGHDHGHADHSGHGHGHDHAHGQSQGNLNIRGATLHVMGDLLGSVAAVISGIVILLWGWTLIDPILSILICLLIVFASFRLLRDAAHVVMEGVPPHLSLKEIDAAMSDVDGVEDVHDLHVWHLSGKRVALSAHILMDDLRDWPPLLARLRKRLQHTFGIEHVTLQPEPKKGVQDHSNTSNAEPCPHIECGGV